MRLRLLLILALIGTLVRAQGTATEATTALGLTRSMSIPLNAVQLFDRVSEAWTWTFGKEPGAKLLLSDREHGVIEGTARVNFRSSMLAGREESMGTITYRILLQIKPGECRAVISGITHAGNSNTARGGIHVGQLMRDENAIHGTPGLSHGNTVRLHAELREASTTRINTILRSMEGRIRASVEP